MIKPQRDPDLHKNHRERLRNTAVQAGLGSLEDHNLLELILFNSIPRQDTNETAHRLLKRFGGISGVLGAEMENVASCENAGEGTAVFLNALGAVCKEYMSCRKAGKTGFVSVNEAREFFYESLKATPGPAMAVLTLDSAHRIKTLKVHSKNGVSYNELLSDAIKDVLSEYSEFAFLAFTHPNGILAPDINEMGFICEAREMLYSRGVKLTDVLIATPDACRFLSGTDIFPENFFNGQSSP